MDCEEQARLAAWKLAKHAHRIRGTYLKNIDTFFQTTNQPARYHYRFNRSEYNHYGKRGTSFNRTSCCPCEGRRYVCYSPIAHHSPDVLSLGKLCQENGNSNAWKEGQSTVLIKGWDSLTCKSDHFVLYVVPSVQVVLHVSSDGNCAPGDRGVSSASGRLQHNVPEWLQPFTEGMVEEDTNPPGRDEKCHPEPLPRQPPLPARP